MIRHIVLCKFKPTLSSAQINNLCQGLLDIKQVIPEVINITGGQPIAKHKYDKDFNYAFVMDFPNAAALQKYLDHSEHIRIANNIIQELESDGLMIFDYVV